MKVYDITQVRPAPEPRFFVDEDLLGLAKALVAARRNDIVHPGHPRLPEVPRQTRDEDWMPMVAERGLTVITRDRHLRSRPRQLQLLCEHKLRVFCLAGQRDMTVWDQLVLVVQAWPRMEAKLAQADPGPWYVSITAAGHLVDKPLTPRQVRGSRRTATPPATNGTVPS